MIHFDFTLEDLRMIADLEGNTWKVFLLDQQTGKRHNMVVTDKQFISIISLMISGDSDEYHYQIAEEALVDCPRECRPIP